MGGALIVLALLAASPDAPAPAKMPAYQMTRGRGGYPILTVDGIDLAITVDDELKVATCRAASEAPADARVEHACAGLLGSRIARSMVPASPLGDAGEWVTPNDYPPVALRAGTEGTSSAALEIGADGRVIHCVTVGSSGSAELDTAACAALTLRARYNPALDAQGKASRSKLVTRVRWQIPQDAGPNEAAMAYLLTSYSIRYEFDVTAAGKAEHCHATMAGEPPRKPPAFQPTSEMLCAGIEHFTFPLPATGSVKAGAPRHVVYSMSNAVTPRRVP